MIPLSPINHQPPLNGICYRGLKEWGSFYLGGFHATGGREWQNEPSYMGFARGGENRKTFTLGN